MQTGNMNERADYFNIPDSLTCRTCGDFISEFPHIEGGKAKCLGGSTDVCRDCCDGDFCKSSRNEGNES